MVLAGAVAGLFLVSFIAERRFIPFGTHGYLSHVAGPKLDPTNAVTVDLSRHRALTIASSLNLADSVEQ